MSLNSAYQIDDSYSSYETLCRRNYLKHEFYHAKDKPREWGLIRQAYMERLPHIMNASKANKRLQINPNFFDWVTKFTPIEERAWMTIRCLGTPLYPQFPLFNYFIDFANPYFRIGLELDGRAYHDEDKDRARDSMLVDYGWKIFRIKGSETVAPYTPIDELDPEAEDGYFEEALEHWLFNTSDGVITALDHVYFQDRRWAYHDLAIETLDKHRLVDFDLF